MEKNIFKAIITGATRTILKRSDGQNKFDNMEYRMLQAADESGNVYRSLLKRPKTCDGQVLHEKETGILKKSAIVMQGQLVAQDHFTVETVRMYHKLYPGALIIVSTWEDENKEIIQELRKQENCVVVLNKYPEFSGLLNLNYQITTTMAGLRQAKASGREYVMKTRCDYRFYKKGMLDYLYCLLQDYPVDPSISYQQYRIVAGGELMNSMYRPFWLADQFNYGYVDDMLLYWDYEMKDIKLNRQQVFEQLEKEHLTWNQRTERHLAAEPEIVLDYFRRTEKRVPELSVESYWERIRKQFIMVSRRELEFYWIKYTDKYDEARSTGTYYEDDRNEICLNYNWDFSQWLLLYRGLLEYDKVYERFSNENRY